MMPGVSPDELETALRIVQTLEPAGIAARDLGECLSLQLQALDRDTPGASSRIEIVTQPSGADGGARPDPACSMPCDRTEDELREAIDLIRGLDPRPAPRSALSSRAPSCRT